MNDSQNQLSKQFGQLGGGGEITAAAYKESSFSSAWIRYEYGRQLHSNFQTFKGENASTLGKMIRFLSLE